jgi:hypothetical protein
MIEIIDIGGIGNYYGGLSIKEEGGCFYWAIENYDGHEWEKIPKLLYDELLAFQASI